MALTAGVLLAAPTAAIGASFTVMNLNGAGAGSLRQAIVDAGLSPETTDTIGFQAGLDGTIEIQSSLAIPSQTLTIAGLGADKITIQGRTDLSFPILSVPAAATLSLTGVKLTGSAGGALENMGDTTLTQIGIRNNPSGAATVSSQGVGADLTLDQSDVVNNAGTASVTISEGGAAIINSTIANNEGTAGVSVTSGGTASFMFSTLAGNSGANLSLAGLTTTATASNSLFADPATGAANCDRGILSTVIGSGGFNIDSGDSCGFATNGQPTDQTNTDPKLMSLGGYGAPTRTMPPDVGSPAIDGGGPGAAIDQRGEQRPHDFPIPNASGGNGSDIGAFELQDIDSDGIGDQHDPCPESPPSIPDTDGDGCTDDFDMDDDADGVFDGEDACPTGAATGADSDGDGCKDDTEDSDDDSDGVPDASDACPISTFGGPDVDGDGCWMSEDADDDNDGILDGADACPAGAASGADNESDGCVDAEDSDDDNDFIRDAFDSCDLLAAPGPSGCPRATRNVNLKFKPAKHKFKGRIRSDTTECIANQTVLIKRKRKGPDAKLGSPLTNGDGTFKLRLKKDPKPGRYYAKVRQVVLAEIALCEAAKSQRVKVP